MRALVVVLALVPAASAAAQQRVEHPELPDLALFEAAPAPGDELAIGYELGTTAAATTTFTEPTGTALAFGGLRLGWRPRVGAGLVLRSDVAAAGDSLRGDHRVVGLFSPSDPDHGDLGFDVTLDHRLRHGPTPLPGSEAELGPAAFVDHRVRGTLAARRVQDKGDLAAGLSLPLSIERRDLRYTDELAPIRARTDLVLEGALGVRAYDRHVPASPRNLIWVRWTRADVERGATLAAAPPPPAVRRFDQIDASLGFEELAIRGTCDCPTVVATMKLGWSWMWEGGTGRAANLLHFDDAVMMSLGGTRMGLGFSRRPALSADGSRFLADWRVALTAEAATRDGVGGSLLAAFGWLTDQERNAGTRPVHRVHSELFVRPFDGGRLGVYSLLTYGAPSWDPWSAAPRFAGELGLTLSWSGSGG